MCKRREIRVGSLFTGIGGLDLGLERAGMRIAWQSEIDPYCCAVLRKHWPHVPNLGDIRGVRATSAPPVDLICGGFPCQPFSFAGKRRGHEDDRYLWPEMLRVIEEFRPRWVLGENVPGIINLALDQVLSDLEALGYETAALVIPACALDAPHRRDRVWILAYAERIRRGGGCDGDARGSSRAVQAAGSSPGYELKDVAVSDSAGWDSWKQTPATMGHGSPSAPEGGDVSDAQRIGGDGWNGNLPATGWEPESGMGRMVDGLSARLDRTPGFWPPEPEGVPRVAQGIANRVDRLKALGNAVVPQVAEAIGRMILEVDAIHKSGS